LPWILESLLFSHNLIILNDTFYFGGQMLAIAGFLIVIASVLIGYLWHGGSLTLLWQPSELVIILGAAVGAFIASSTRYSIRQCLVSIKQVFFPRAIGKETYTQTLTLLYALFSKMHRDGIISIEQDIEKPEDSPLFRSFPMVAADIQVCRFIGDTMRTYLTTGKVDELGELMDADVKSIQTEMNVAPSKIGHMAESLPGMGIVAAVLGVVLTMSKLNSPPDELGGYIGAALLGTFLGILFCYGFIGPLSAKLESLEQERVVYLSSVREAILAVLRGLSPMVALEYGRRSIPPKYRPSFPEMEERLKNVSTPAPRAA
jgi:chemotaxis protein MotA